MSDYASIMQGLEDALSKPGGLDTVPLAEEKYRPLLHIFVEITQQYGPQAGLMLFDKTDKGPDAPADKVFAGAPIYLPHLQTVIEDYTDRVIDVVGDGGKLAMFRGPEDMVVVYCPELWIPAAALGKARH